MDVDTGAGLADKWRRLEDLVALGNRQGSRFRQWSLTRQLEIEILTGRIVTMRDAIAKLEMARLSFQDGPRGDGLDAQALDDAIVWLGALCGWMRHGAAGEAPRANAA